MFKHSYAVSDFCVTVNLPGIISPRVAFLPDGNLHANYSLYNFIGTQWTQIGRLRDKFFDIELHGEALFPTSGLRNFAPSTRTDHVSQMEKQLP